VHAPARGGPVTRTSSMRRDSDAQRCGDAVCKCDWAVRGALMYGRMGKLFLFALGTASHDVCGTAGERHIVA